MIKLEFIKKNYTLGKTTLTALDNINLKIEQGEFLSIIGRSGSGKSTLLNVIGLLDTPDEGKYELFGKDISLFNDTELAQMRNKVFGFVFQQFHLLPRLTALENVKLSLLYSGNLENSDKRSISALEKVGLMERQNHRPNELSGGQQQRVAIARALVNNPSIILADEPTGNLDSRSGKEILEILKNLNSEGSTVIIVTHDELVAKETNRTIKISDGRISEDTGFSKKEKKIFYDVSQKSKASFLNEISENFFTGLNALLNNKTRTFLSMLGILIGVAAVITMIALGTGARKSVEAQFSSLGASILTLRPGPFRHGGVWLEPGSVTRFTQLDAESIKENVANIKSISPVVSGKVTVAFKNKNYRTQLIGASSEYENMKVGKPQSGRFFTPEEDKSRKRVALLGKTVIKEISPNSSIIGETIKINKISFLVIGVLKERGASGFRDEDDVVIIPINTAMKRVLGKQYVDSIEIEVADKTKINDAEEAIKTHIIKKHDIPESKSETFNIRNMAAIREALSSASRIMSLLLAIIAAISLVVGGIGIMNIMLVSVTERTKEIGLRKAIGANNLAILTQFLIEAMIISGSGGIMGILIGIAATKIISGITEWTTIISLFSVIISFLFSFVIGIIFGIWPAKKASKLNPVEALRYE